MTGRTRHTDRYTVSPRLDAEVRIDEQGYLHTGTAQRQPRRVIVTCGTTEAKR